VERKGIMKKAFVSGLVISLSFGVCAESVTNNLDVQGGFIYNHGMINPGDMGMTFTNAGIRDVTVSAGQLSGVDPETGEVITNALNLISLKARSLETSGDIVSGGSFSGNASGLTHLSASRLTGKIKAANMPSSGTWNASGITINNAKLTGGTVSAGGSSGSIQFNDNGILSGNPNFFIHPTEKKPAFRSPSGYFFRGYKSEPISDDNLIYSLRNEDGTSVLRLRKDGQDKIVLSGDGTITLNGQSITNWPAGGGITNVAWGSITGTLVGQSDLANALAAKAAQSDLNAVSNALAGKMNNVTLAPVATSGSYADLADKPALAPIATDANFANLTVADGAITQTKVSGLTNDLGAKLNTAWTNSLGTMAYAATSDYISASQAGNFVDKTAATNLLAGQVTVQGAFIARYIPPQGDLLMGSYTNGVPQ